MSQLNIETFAFDTQTSQLNEWIFQTIQPFIKDRILELSTPSGPIASHLIGQGFTVHLNSPSEYDRQFLKKKFEAEPLVKGVHKINLLNSHMEVKYSGFQGRFSTVIVLDHMSESPFYNTSVLRKAVRFLRPGGHFVTIGQCPVDLFPDQEEDFRLLKKYNRDTIEERLTGCEPVLIRFLRWKGLCFVAVGRKPSV